MEKGMKKIIVYIVVGICLLLSGCTQKTSSSDLSNALEMTSQDAEGKITKSFRDEWDNDAANILCDDNGAVIGVESRSEEVSVFDFVPGGNADAYADQMIEAQWIPVKILLWCNLDGDDTSAYETMILRKENHEIAFTIDKRDEDRKVCSILGFLTDKDGLETEFETLINNSTEGGAIDADN